ncbi:MAG: hypothetical protein JSV81_03805 [Anaerolineales bacterium]|nr:MAG: hypothetical protein JSV81_03805 [Anaerolineales bacterium]
MDQSNTALEKRITADFLRARRRALLNYVLAFLSGKHNRLLVFQEVHPNLRSYQEVYLGIHSVEMVKIVGCVNRCQDFDRHFLPTQSSSAERWKSISRAYYQSIQLPPPILLKASDVYFVYDGYHRISVAQLHGVTHIEADIIEYVRR